ncbi:MAG: glycine cleavage system protein GcvH [Candidatus Fermentibacteraceae bacterium]
MSRIDEGIRYTESHEWVKKDGENYIMGITDHAQHEMGEIVMVELPAQGAQAVRGEALGAIEAVKTAEDFYAPLDGKVVKVNSELDGNPALVNEDPYGKGWLLVIKAVDPAQYDELLSPDQYRALAGE